MFVPNVHVHEREREGRQVYSFLEGICWFGATVGERDVEMLAAAEGRNHWMAGVGQPCTS